MKIEVLLPTHIIAGACAQSLLLWQYRTTADISRQPASRAQTIAYV